MPANLSLDITEGGIGLKGRKAGFTLVPAYGVFADDVEIDTRLHESFVLSAYSVAWLQGGEPRVIARTADGEQLERPWSDIVRLHNRHQPDERGFATYLLVCKRPEDDVS